MPTVRGLKNASFSLNIKEKTPCGRFIFLLAESEGFEKQGGAFQKPNKININLINTGVCVVFYTTNLNQFMTVSITF
jgi:hypothetical protein